MSSLEPFDAVYFNLTDFEADIHCRIEKLIREDLASNNHDRIAKVVKQLCKDYAYDVHHPYARTGGLIGLAAASIALGSVCKILFFFPG